MNYISIFIIGYILGFLIGSYLMKKANDLYWVRRIKQGEIPIGQEAIEWNPLNETKN